MSDISPIGSPRVTDFGTGRAASRNATGAAASPGPGRGRDQVELSQQSQLLSKLAELPDVRQDLVDHVRSQIAAGTYETPEKVDAAVNALAQEL